MLPRPCCVRRSRTSALLVAALSLFLWGRVVSGSEEVKAKPSPDEALGMLKAGNERFASGKVESPHTDATRLHLAGSASQADYAYATVLACSDSRVPVERIFDAGVMDIFVVRVAGNVCNTDEIGSIEYGLAHVRTPVLVILGHTQCGAVTAVTQHLQGRGHALERNIPPLIKSIEPAVKRAMEENAALGGPELVAKGIEANVWTGIENLFRASPAVRELAGKNKVKIVGAIYDVGTGRVDWLPETTVHRLLGRVEMDPSRATEAMAHDEGAVTHAEVKAATTPHPAPGTRETIGPRATEPTETKSPHAVPTEEPKRGGPHDQAKDVHAKAGDGAHATPTRGKPEVQGEAPVASASPSEKTAKGESQGENKEALSAVVTVDTPAQGGRPWGLIALCGIVFVLGLGVVLTSQFMRDKPEAKAPPTPSAPAQAAAATAKTPAQVAQAAPAASATVTTPTPAAKT